MILNGPWHIPRVVRKENIDDTVIDLGYDNI